MRKTIDVILPRYREQKDTILSTKDKMQKFLHEKDITPHFIISQNGPHQKLDFDDHEHTNLHSEYAGLGHALKNASKHLRGEWFFFTSPDNPFDFSDLEAMLAVAHEYDLIIGSKLHPLSEYQAPLKRKLFSRLQNLGTRVILPGFPVRDPSGTLFGTKATGELLGSMASEDYFISSELIWHLHKSGKKVHEVPVKYSKVDKSSTVNIKKYAFDSMKNLLKIRMGKTRKSVFVNDSSDL